jgi:DnaK suppressor protein
MGMTTHTTPTHSPFATALVPAEVDEDLARYEAARVRQLQLLDPTERDPVAAAHRESVVRILDEIRIARRRLAAGLYGKCAGCGMAIAVERLELRPWTTTCVDCARRGR